MAIKSTLQRRSRFSGLPAAELPVDKSLFAPGDRIRIAVSGGADSTALLRTLLAQRAELGIVLSVLHVEHGLRGDLSRADASFVAELAKQFDLSCEVIVVDTGARAAQQKESIEEAARNLRYKVFRDVLASGKADKIATAHTLDDQAETVLMKLLRGAWTEGLSGIHPVLQLDNAGTQLCIRPLLNVTRAEIETYLRSLNQSWREDETNRSLAYTRNCVRHELLPALREYNPRINQALAHVAANARAEERHWQQELARVLPQLLLPGKPVRGGGRSVATAAGSISVAVEIVRLRALDSGLRRRVLRAIAEQCGATLDFDATESLLTMAMTTSASRRLELPNGVRVERSARELQFESMPTSPVPGKIANPPTYQLSIPGTIEAPAFQSRYTASFNAAKSIGPGETTSVPPACVRAWQPGDRVELAHSSGPKKVKEILERMGIRGEQRTLWPVILWQGSIVWMRGVQLRTSARETTPAHPGELTIEETPL
jgi:tRNA(Ile)-lysidine synthase